jgi:adenine-specific DNA-methyltransferase
VSYGRTRNGRSGILVSRGQWSRGPAPCPPQLHGKHVRNRRDQPIATNDRYSIGGRKTGGHPYGPDNPHPLSKLTTELVWEGKYDEYGNRREVDVAGAAMPMQKIETIDQPRSEAAAAGPQQLLAFDKRTTRLDDFRNMLIWGDNKLVMASLLKEFKGCIDLIYIDPPFDVGADFTTTIDIGDAAEETEKDQSALEMVAYRDMWGKGRDSYLHTMFESLTLLNVLLKDSGSIFVHVDVHMGPYLVID